MTANQQGCPEAVGATGSGQWAVGSGLGLIRLGVRDEEKRDRHMTKSVNKSREATLAIKQGPRRRLYVVIEESLLVTDSA